MEKWQLAILFALVTAAAGGVWELMNRVRELKAAQERMHSDLLRLMEHNRVSRWD